MGLHRVAERPGRGSPDGAHRGGGLALVASGRLERGIELGGPALVVEQGGEPGLGVVGERHHLGEVVAVLALEVVQELAPGPDGCEALGVVLDPLGEGAEVAQHVVELDRRRAEAVVGGGERRPALELGDGDAESVQHPAVGRDGVEGAGGGFAVGGGVGEEVLLRLQRAVLLGIVDAGGGELGGLEPQQVDLAGTAALVAAQERQLVEDAGPWRRGPP